MKATQLILPLLLMLLSLSARADDSKIIVWLQDGSKTEIPFDDMPEFGYTGGNVTITTGGQTYTWSLAELDKFTFESSLSTFIFSDNEDNTLAVLEKSGDRCNFTLHRTLRTGSYNTLALPFDVSGEMLSSVLGEGTVAKQLTSSSLNEGVLTLGFTDATSLEAGSPYLVKVPSDVENPTFGDVTLKSVTTTVKTGFVDFVPILGKTLVTGPSGSEDDTHSVLFLSSGNTLYTPTAVNDADNDESYIKGFRAYFQLHTAAALAKSFRINLGEDEATALRTIQEAQFTVDSETAAWHTLDGRRLSGKPAWKGIYLLNGSKVVIK